MGFIILKHMLCVDDARVKQAEAVRLLSLSTRPCFFLSPRHSSARSVAHTTTRVQNAVNLQRKYYTFAATTERVVVTGCSDTPRGHINAQSSGLAVIAIRSIFLSVDSLF